MTNFSKYNNLFTENIGKICISLVDMDWTV